MSTEDLFFMVWFELIGCTWMSTTLSCSTAHLWK